MFEKNIIECAAGQWTVIISSYFAQMPKFWNVRLIAETGEAAGEYEETKSVWIFPGTPTVGQIAGEMRFERGYWNTFYKVRLRPQTAVIVEFL